MGDRFYQSVNERVTNHEDWKDSINVFRLKIRQELTEINERLDRIMKVLSEQNKN